MSETIRATLTRLAARLDAVENLIGHNGGPPLEDEIAEGSSQDRKLSKRELARRWGRSTRSIDRMRQRCCSSDSVSSFRAPASSRVR